MFSPSHWDTFHLLLQKLAKLFYFTTAYNIVFLKNVLKKKTGKILEQVNFFFRNNGSQLICCHYHQNEVIMSESMQHFMMLTLVCSTDSQDISESTET